MTKIKICGLTRVEDVKWANELLPDFVGFVFAKSKRQVDAQRALEISSALDAKIKKVGVFVNPSLVYIDEVVSECPLDILQLHGDESPEFVNSQSIPVWKAVRVRTKETLSIINYYKADAFLIEGYNPDAYGGGGGTFPWEWAKDLASEKTIVLAGGLDTDNVAQAIRMLKPYAVDVSSSVETDGKKDPDKIKTFMEKVRQTDEQLS